METRTLTVEVPEEVVTLLGSAEDASARARQALVLDLLREARISQGKAAEILGISRWAILELMTQHHIESGPANEAELQQDLEVVRRVTETSAAAEAGRGGRQ